MTSNEDKSALGTLGLHHLALQVHDLEGAVRWYRELFAFETLREWKDDHGRLRSVWLGLSQGAFLALERCAEAPPKRGPWRHGDPGYHVFALRIAVGGRDPWLRRLAARNIPVDHQSQWTVYFRDPEGNRIGLSHHPHDAEPS